MNPEKVILNVKRKLGYVIQELEIQEDGLDLSRRTELASYKRVLDLIEGFEAMRDLD